jgi:FixJ family two-component response regulator
MGGDCFDCLAGTVHVAVLDDDPLIRSALTVYLELCPLCAVQEYETATQVAKAFFAGTPCHVLFMDLGISDCGGDDLYLVKQFGKTVPTVCVSGRHLPKTAFWAAQQGAWAFIDKTDIVNRESLLNWVEKGVLWSLAARTCVADRRALVERAIEALHTTKPRTVTEWARGLDITESHLRDVWTATCTAVPKHVVFLVQLYAAAFAYYREPGQATTSDERRRMRRYNVGRSTDLSRIVAGAARADSCRSSPFRAGNGPGRATLTA